MTSTPVTFDTNENVRSMHTALDGLDLVVLRDELNVDWSRHVRHVPNLRDLAHSLPFEVLRRVDERRVARVHTSVLSMLQDSVHHEFAGDRAIPPPPA